MIQWLFDKALLLSPYTKKIFQMYSININRIEVTFLRISALLWIIDDSSEKLAKRRWAHLHFSTITN